MPKKKRFKFDVFISYSSKDEDWVVGTLLPRLNVAGLKTHIHFRDFAAGKWSIINMNEAVRNSRHTLLVLTNNWFRSKWTKYEALQTFSKDPLGYGQRTIPLLLGKCGVPKDFKFISDLTNIDFTRADQRDSAWDRLFTTLGVPPQQLQVADIDEVLKWQWDGNKLLDKLIALDYATTYANKRLARVHEGNIDQWAPVFMDNPDTWRLLITGPENIVGYWHIAPLFPREYRLAKSGKLLDSQITADKVRPLVGPNRYNVYFVQVCLLPEHRKASHRKLLLETFFSVLDILSAQKIFVREICANAFTGAGESLCKHFNLKRKVRHSKHGEIYAGRISAVLRNPLAQQFPELQNRYAVEGLK